MSPSIITSFSPSEFLLIVVTRLDALAHGRHFGLGAPAGQRQRGSPWWKDGKKKARGSENAGEALENTYENGGKISVECMDHSYFQVIRDNE